MKTKLTFLLCLFVAQISAYAQTVEVSASEADAKIIVDGQSLGTGSLKVKVPKNSCVNVKVTKAGFLLYEQTYCNKKGMTEPPKKQFFA
ncbi:hypothetical protein ACJVDH_15910 [Pedobacter sp. AW1-32]|uniref:hypothetical protein n=1 Tax=Pedobacter sp. AW1-32 TaxID=3383026 RepID=UPI003FEE29CF